MFLTRKLNFMMFMICCMAQMTQASDVRDEQGRTELMNYVIQKEVEIKIKKAELDKLWDLYFYEKKFVRNTVHVNGQNINIHDSITLRKIDTTDANGIVNINILSVY